MPVRPWRPGNQERTAISPGAADRSSAPLTPARTSSGGVESGPDRIGSERRSTNKGQAVWLWVLLNSLAGPTIGVGCYQWALENNPSGVVLPVVATTPIVVMPFAFLFEGDRPGPRSLLGGIIAVAGAVALALSR